MTKWKTILFKAIHLLEGLPQTKIMIFMVGIMRIRRVIKMQEETKNEK